MQRATQRILKILNSESKKQPVKWYLGRSPRPESLMDRKEAKRAKATRLAAVDVVSESGIPADRGSFGA